MGKLRFTLTSIIFWIVLVLSCFLSENITLFAQNPNAGLSFQSAAILTACLLVLFAIYFFFEHKNNKIGFEKILLPCLAFFGIIMILNIVRQGDRTLLSLDGSNEITVAYTIFDRFLSISQVIVWLLVIYAIVFVSNRFRISKESFRWLAKAFWAFIIVAIIADLFYEHQKIGEVFTSPWYQKGLQFIFGNGNVWAFLVVLGVLSALVLSTKKFFLPYYVSMILMTLYLFLTKSSTCIVISAFAVFCYTLYEIISLLKTNKKRALILLALLGSAIIVAVSIVLIFINVDSLASTKIGSLLRGLFLDKHFDSFSGRTNIWKGIIDILKENSLDMFLGLGHGTGNKFFRLIANDGYSFYGGLKSAHNGFMEILLRYGIFGLVIYASLIGLIIFCFVLHIRKKNYRFAFIYGLAFIAILFHSIFESTTIFTPNVEGLYIGIIFALPILSILQSKHFDELKESLEKEEIANERLKGQSVFMTLMLFVASILITKIAANIANLELFSALVILITLLLISLIIADIICKNNINNVVLLDFKKRVMRNNENEK